MTSSSLLQRRQRQARRTVLAAALTFALGQAAIRAVIEGPLSFPVRFPSAVPILREAERLRGSSVDVVLLGSSRLASFARADLMHEAAASRLGRPLTMFVAAVPAGDSVAMDFLFERMLARGLRARAVLIEVSAETLTRPEWMAPFAITRQLTCMQAVRLLPEIIESRALSRVMGACIVPGFLYRQELLQWTTGRTPPFFTVPAAPAPPPDTALLAERNTNAAAKPPPPVALETNALGWRGGRFEAGGVATKAFEHLLRAAAASHTRVVLLRPPVASRLRATYTGRAEAGFVGYLGAVTREFDARLIDLRSAVPDDLLTDLHHGSSTGAAFFSPILGQALAGVLADFAVSGKTQSLASER